MNKQRIIISLGIVCMASLCSCSHNEETEDANQPVELGIKTSIALTRAVETGAAFANAQSIAVYANNTTTNATTNNYAVYTYASSGSTWSANGSDKIYLSAEPATIYAHYPAYSGTGTTTPLKVNDYTTSGVTATSTVNVSTFEGVTTAADDNNKITLTGSSNNDINAAPGETDYMYATKSNATDQPQASNGKSTGSNSGLTKSVDLQMNHALTMVSFRIYKDENYNNTGKLTKIELKNASGNTTPLSKASAGYSTTMNISTGAITLPSGNQEAATYTRYIYDNSNAGYTIKEAPSGSNAENSPAFSILVFPVASISANAIKVTFTIDDTPYEISIPSSGSSTGWKAGNNNIYKVTMNSIGLEIGTVTIKPWSSQTTVDGGNLVNDNN